jgi:hypothetical protein
LLDEYVLELRVVKLNHAEQRVKFQPLRIVDFLEVIGADSFEDLSPKELGLC